jgi:tetratricopeptide (TPR) repeat protein
VDYSDAIISNLPPLYDHPLYKEGMALVGAGQWQPAFEQLKLLRSIYPDNTELNAMFDEVQMRATAARFQPRPKSAGHKKKIIRRLAIGLLLLSSLVIGAYVIYETWITPVLLHELRLRRITRLQEEADTAIVAGDYQRAREALEQLQTILPNNIQTLKSLQRVEQAATLADFYAQAQALMAANEWEQAVQTLKKLQAIDPLYRDVPQLLQIARQAQTLNQQFLAAEAAFNAADWTKAIQLYSNLQQANLTFRFEEIQTGLFNSHLQYGQSLITTAKTNPEKVTQALSHFTAALTLQPVNPEALLAHKLAQTYLAALNQANPDEAINLLQSIYQEQPTYAGQQAVQLLYEMLLKRADSLVQSGDQPAALADYRLASQLLVTDPSLARQKLVELGPEQPAN